MKKRILDKLNFIIFIVTIFFTFNDNVKAANYTCFYKDKELFSGSYYSDSNLKKKLSNLYIRLEYADKNGSITKKKFKFYASKKAYSKIYDSEGNEFKISSSSGKDLVVNDFSEGCPIIHRFTDSEIVYDIFKNNSDYYKKFFVTPMKDYSKGTEYSKIKKACWAAKKREACDKLIPTTISATKEDNSNIMKCEYDSINSIIEGGQDRDITTIILLKMNKTTGNVTIFNSNSADPDNYNAYFKSSTTCPNSLYTDSSNKNYYDNENSAALKKAKEQYGLIKKISITEKTKEKSKTGCAALGKLGDYIKTAYNLIRFLIPIIIIVMSVIDFTSVVLSGENDNMEKAKKRFVIRLIAGIIILFVPAVLELLLRLIGILESDQSLANVVCNIF